ncbi:MAG: GNAT family N-acetyltransferase [Clostridiales bacterium]|nr:GNAT family N-acetyltransferase [Clostridiales bacterium]
MMHQLTYARLITADDPDVPQLLRVHSLPGVAEYLSISDGYFRYVTGSDGVHFFKVYESGNLVGSVHLERQGLTLFMAILVFPEHQGSGLGSAILRDVQDDVFGLGYERIEAAIDESNAASLLLFERAGFRRTGQVDELITFVYHRNRT